MQLDSAIQTSKSSAIINDLPFIIRYQQVRINESNREYIFFHFRIVFTEIELLERGLDLKYDGELHLQG